MMFTKKKSKINPNTTDTLIGEGSTFEGRIKSEASLRVEGQVIGDIECKGDVTVGESGLVRSNVSARNVVIAGSVYGNVLTKGTLTINSSGQLHGNTSAHSLIIAEGGIFQGASKMDNKITANDKPEKETPSQSYAQNYNHPPTAM